MAFTVFMYASAPASADFTLCEPGSEAGQCKEPEEVAIDPATGNVYVAETGNSRISVFDPAGEFLFAFGWGVADGTTNALQTCTTTCFQGLAGSGAGQLPFGALSIAIDSDPASPSYRDLYIAERENIRVQKFSPAGEFILMLGGGVNKTTGADLCTAESGDDCGIGIEDGGDGEFRSLVLRVAVGPGGKLYVGDAVSLEGGGNGTRVQSFEPSGSFVGKLVEAPIRLDALAVDTSGDFYLGFGATTGSWEKYESDGTPAGTNPTPVDTFTTHNLRQLAIGPADHLFSAETDGAQGRREITEYDSAGNVLRRFGYGKIAENLVGLAVDAGGGVFASERFKDRVFYLSPPGAGALACCTEVTPGNTKATLKGGVNPEGKATSYRFEYLSEDDYVANGNSFSGPNTPAVTPTTPIGEDLSLHDVEAQIGCTNPPAPSCLAPATAYRYRLVADNADGQSVSEGSFETKPPFEILETYATAVSTDSARLNASVNPFGIPATGHFEYVTEADYQADREEGGDGFAAATQGPEIDLGSGNAPKAASQHLSKLPPGTAYRYRIVVSDSFVAGVPGPERAFTTFALPSPPSNACPNAGFRAGPSALLPDCRAYEMVSPVDKNGGDIKVLLTILNYPARLDQSSSDGDSIAYSSVAAFAGAKSAPWTSQYIGRRTAGQGWSAEAISPPRKSSSLLGLNFILRDQFKAFSPDLSSGWFLQDTDLQHDECAPAGFPNLYRREADGTYEALVASEPTGVPKGEQLRYELQGLSADGSHSVIRVNAKLTPEAANKGQMQLYMRVADEGCGELRLVSALPNGTANPIGSTVGSGGAGSDVAAGEGRDNTVGRAVSADGTRVYWTARDTTSVTPLYLRINADQEPSADGKCSEPEKACTLQITSVGTKFWSASTDGSKAIYEISQGPQQGNLYEYDLAKALAGEQPSTPIASQSRGMVAASEDASRVYFVSEEAIGGEGEAGRPNLYLYDAAKAIAERYRLVATVADTDVGSSVVQTNGFVLTSQNPIQNGVRATTDGGRLAFVSSAGLAGYDSKSAAEGKPTLEVYLYDAAAEELACVSCNPTGSRPVGRVFKGNTTALNVAAQLPPGETQTFAPRALSADGNSLFFEAFEALLPRDTNGKADVYEWQSAPDQAACNAIGAELYVPRALGCISLISTGQSASDSEIADASPDGSNVFIRTASGLLPQDPGQVDLYDARVGGGLPQPPPTPAACEGEACQGPLAPPQEQTPASSTFQGPGNVKPAPKPKPCGKGKVRRKGRCVPKRGKGSSKQNGHRQNAKQNGKAGR